MSLSKYRECQKCKHKFIVPKSTLKYENNNPNIVILCPRCLDSNIAVIKKFSR